MDERRTALGDPELARRIMASPAGHAGEEERELCARFERRVRLYGLRHLRDGDAARDLAQRVLLVTLEKLRARELRDAERIASFVLGTARVVALEMARRRSREAPAPDPLAGFSDDACGPVGLDAERLLECVEALGARERAVVLMTFYEEQSAAAIAQVFSTTEGNVRVIRHRAIARLRACMGEAGEELP